ncbi:GNAT family N-acetyltransferase [Kribbella kalugense]|uniref:GNAT family N-acetyltransferase n=1 Tax=Kribbella kalugense TaxID=2512221 RepID=UPI0010670935|nr:GNAT family N-acetyltransferase [Kribbella kalugense]
MQEIRVSEGKALTLATELLRRVRLAEREAGLWEAADVEWWGRKARRSEGVEQLFWVDGDGPVAGVLLTSWADDLWQCDPIVVPGVTSPSVDQVWAGAMAQVGRHAAGSFEVPVRDDDRQLSELVAGAGLVAGERSSVAWMEAAHRPPIDVPPAGFVLVDRTQRSDSPHPMRLRNGEGVAERLRRCSLYDPELDLAIETSDGQGAAYSLYWFDPVTGVGLVEPVRVEDEYHRRGLARAMLTAGIDRLAARGARRIKVGFESAPAAALYQGVGFRPTATVTFYKATI